MNKTHIFRFVYFSLGVSNKRPWKSFSGWNPKKMKVWEDDVPFSYRCFQVPCSFSDDICVYIYIHVDIQYIFS